MILSLNEFKSSSHESGEITERIKAFVEEGDWE